MAKTKKKIKEKDIPTRKAWVVLESSFEYDDNYYNQEGDGGTPIKVYLDKVRAEEACFKANISELCTLDLGSYSYSLRESEGTKETIIRLVKDAGGTIEQDDDNEFKIDLPDSITESQVDEIINELGISFNSVTEIDLEMYLGED